MRICKIVKEILKHKNPYSTALEKDVPCVCLENCRFKLDLDKYQKALVKKNLDREFWINFTSNHCLKSA